MIGDPEGCASDDERWSHQDPHADAFYCDVCDAPLDPDASTLGMLCRDCWDAIDGDNADREAAG